MATKRTLSDLFFLLVVAPIRWEIVQWVRVFGWIRFFAAVALCRPVKR